MKNWVKLLVLVVAVVIVATLLVKRAQPPATDDAPAPPLALNDLAGRKVDLAALRGKVVAVNFWATWCGPCQMEMPELARTWQEHHGKCFELLGVAEESGREDVQSVAARIPYPLVVDERAAALGPWGVEGYPTTFVLDPKGRVRRVFRGTVDQRELEEAIAPLLPASCPTS